jgi:hypothetical protein
MLQADFNHNDFSNQQEADKALMVRFFYKECPDANKTREMGRPMFREKTYIELRVAGQRDVQACRPATMADKNRFPNHFEAFEKRVEPPTEGMPLSEWPQITRTQAEELSFMNAKTVEQLASMKDSNLGAIMGGYALREKAQKWLTMNDADTVDREKEEMRTTIATLQAQMAQMLAAKAPEVRVNALLPESGLDKEPEEGAAIPVPAAPATRKRRTKK